MTNEIQAVAIEPRRFKLSKVGFLEFLAYSAITWLIGFIVYGVVFFLFVGIFVGIAASSAKAANAAAPMGWSVEQSVWNSPEGVAVRKKLYETVKVN